MRRSLTTLGSKRGRRASFSSKARHSEHGYATRHGSSDAVSTNRSSPDVTSASRNRAGRLVRPFASIACSYCPCHIARPDLRGTLCHFVPLVTPPYGSRAGPVKKPTHEILL